MSSPIIYDFLIDDDNEGKFAVHGVTARRVAQVLDSACLVIPNRKRRRGLYLVIGRDHGGRAITIPIENTRQPKVWRPITAWFSKPHEVALLQRKE